MCEKLGYFTKQFLNSQEAYGKSCSTSVVIRKVEMKITIDYFHQVTKLMMVVVGGRQY